MIITDDLSIEELYKSGTMPDWIYYQMNGKDINENYQDFLRKRQKENQELLEARKNRQKQQQIDEAQIEQQVYKTAERALEKLLEGFNKK